MNSRAGVLPQRQLRSLLFFSWKRKVPKTYRGEWKDCYHGKFDCFCALEEISRRIRDFRRLGSAEENRESNGSALT